MRSEASIKQYWEIDYKAAILRKETVDLQQTPNSCADITAVRGRA